MGNIAKQLPEFDKERLRSDREDRNMPHFPRAEAFPDFQGELPPQIVDLQRPILRFAVAIVRADHLEADRCLERIASRQHGVPAHCGRNEAVMFADTRRIVKDMRSAVRCDGGHDCDPLFVRLFHREEARFRMTGHILAIDQPVMRIA